MGRNQYDHSNRDKGNPQPFEQYIFQKSKKLEERRAENEVIFKEIEEKVLYLFRNHEDSPEFQLARQKLKEIFEDIQKLNK